MKWFSEQTDLDYLMKCDDDLYVRDVVGLFDDLFDFNAACGKKIEQNSLRIVYSHVRAFVVS